MIHLNKLWKYDLKISIVNGSQKKYESNTGIILDILKIKINNTHELSFFNCGINELTGGDYKKIICADAIILAFPLFVHSLPSNTLKFLIELEKIIKQEQACNLIMYAIINNGFYEGKQNNIAFEILKNWCEHNAVKFGGGIGQGAGEMLGKMKFIPVNTGFFGNFADALRVMLKKLELRETFEVIYLSPYFPRFLWKLLAERYWKKLAANNGLKTADMYKFPDD